MQRRHPASELGCIGERGRQEDHAAGIRQADDGLFPHDAAVAVLHVVDLVEDDPDNLAHHL